MEIEKRYIETLFRNSSHRKYKNTITKLSIDTLNKNLEHAKRVNFKISSQLWWTCLKKS